MREQWLSSQTTPTEDPSAPVRLLHTECGCALHDAHNSLRWVYSTLFDSADDLLKQMYIGLQSYRASVSAALGSLAPWLVQVLHPVPASEVASEEHLRQLYSALGVSADLLADLCGEMHLLWNQEFARLEILDTYLKQSASLGRISDMLLCLWRFPQFCSSRWVTIGSSCRAYLQGLNTGYAHLFRKMRTEGAVSEYDGSGGDQLGAQTNLFAVVMGLVAFLPETFMTLLLRDSRLISQAEALRSALEDEFAHVEDLPPFVWQTLAKFTPLAAPALRDRVIAGEQIAFSFLDWRIFEQIGNLPWSLALGDLDSNLADLRRQAEPPEDPVAKSIWIQMQAGATQQELKAILKLLSSVSFTSHTTEMRSCMSLLHYNMTPKRLKRLAKSGFGR